MKIFNKKAVSLGGWTESIIFSLIVIIGIGIILSGMNERYIQSYDFPLETGAITSSIITLQNQTSSKILTGDVNFFTVWGITLSTSWDIIVSVIQMIWMVFNGAWITTIGAWLHIPIAIVFLLRGLFILSIGFIILKILFKVKV